MSLGTCQYIQLAQHEDCIIRTKKRISFDSNLAFWLLDNSSTHNNSFQKTCEILKYINENLCPGDWCNRGHCRNFSTRHAYNCRETRPKVCKEYVKYNEKLAAKKGENQ